MNMGMDIEECVKIWNRLIETLRDNCLANEDVPVMQGMLQFFKVERNLHESCSLTTLKFLERL